MSETILIVDDHALYREGIRGLLKRKGFRVVGEAEDGREALEKVRELSPDVVVMDISMPHLDGIKATRGIMTASPDTKVIALSMHGGKRFVEDMLQAGAVGYILKDAAPEQLVDGVHAVLRGETYMSPAVTGLVVSQYIDLLSRVQAAGDPAKLTKKELRFLQLAGEGCSSEEIASHLDTGEAAVNTMQKSVLKKLDLSSFAELTEYAGAQKWFSGQEGMEAALQQAVNSGRKKVGPPKPQALVEPLTNRELDVLALLAKRLYDKEIAEELSVSVTTVRTHVSNLFQKLGVAKRHEAVDKSRELGIIE
jgi:DNA-binding NarL/FixJ family response regulator